LAHLGKRKSAISAFVEVIQAVDAEEGKRVTRHRAAQLDAYRDLAILGIARVFYSLGRYTDAAAWDDQVSKRSPRWPEAQLEAAWADFMLDARSSVRPTSTGAVTGRVYRFAAPGAVVAVDPRDAPGFLAFPNLRRM
jgi:hypothetical protein